MNMFISSSANYDPSTGSFVGEVGMDLVSARFIDLSQRDYFQVKHTGIAAQDDIREAAKGKRRTWSCRCEPWFTGDHGMAVLPVIQHWHCHVDHDSLETVKRGIFNVIVRHLQAALICLLPLQCR